MLGRSTKTDQELARRGGKSQRRIFRSVIGDRQRRLIEEASRIDVKAPGGKPREFSPDAAMKQATAATALRQSRASPVVRFASRLTR